MKRKATYWKNITAKKLMRAVLDCISHNDINYVSFPFEGIWEITTSENKEANILQKSAVLSLQDGNLYFVIDLSDEILVCYSRIKKNRPYEVTEELSVELERELTLCEIKLVYQLMDKLGGN